MTTEDVQINADNSTEAGTPIYPRNKVYGVGARMLRSSGAIRPYFHLGWLDEERLARGGCAAALMEPRGNGWAVCGP